MDHHFYVDCASDLTLEDQTVTDAVLFQAVDQVATAGW